MTNRTSTPAPRWLRVALRCGAVCLLAGGLVYCTDQSNLTSVDPAVVPIEEEAVLHLDDRGDDPAADAPLRPQQAMHMLRERIKALATEHALPADLAETLRDHALSVSPHMAEEKIQELARTPDAFLAVTPDDGTGDYRTVMMDLAGLRSALSEGPLSPEALQAELARHVRVSRTPNLSLLRGMHFECAADEGAKLSPSDLLAGRMTCKTTKASRFKIHVNNFRLKG